jgi:GNAT superfamily N-acetyltransferase
MILRSMKMDDLDSLYSISIATGLCGGDASKVYADRHLMGHIYSAPYCVLLPEFGVIVEDGTGVAGFAVGAPDTRMWEERLNTEWWPSLQKRYPAPDLARQETWSADERRMDMIHHPSPVPQEVVAQFPAHMHMNLLPRIQRKGVGRQLFEKWKDLAIDQGVGALHVGVNRRNGRALHFWHALAFEEIEVLSQSIERTAWLGQHLR